MLSGSNAVGITFLISGATYLLVYMEAYVKAKT